MKQNDAQTETLRWSQKEGERKPVEEQVENNNKQQQQHLKSTLQEVIQQLIISKIGHFPSNTQIPRSVAEIHFCVPVLSASRWPLRSVPWNHGCISENVTEYLISVETLLHSMEASLMGL